MTAEYVTHPATGVLHIADATKITFCGQIAKSWERKGETAWGEASPCASCRHNYRGWVMRDAARKERA